VPELHFSHAQLITWLSLSKEFLIFNSFLRSRGWLVKALRPTDKLCFPKLDVLKIAYFIPVHRWCQPQWELENEMADNGLKYATQRPSFQKL